MRSTLSLLFFAPALALAQAPGAMLRLSCEGDSLNAEVSINGKFRGECPVDVQVPEGLLKIEAHKSIDAEHERVFVQNVRMAEGSIKRIDIVLGEPRLTAAAQQHADERRRIAEEQARRREEERQAMLAAQQQREEAELAPLRARVAAGDSGAMVALGDRYALGQGVPRDAVTAQQWYAKARDAGNDLGTLRLSNAKQSMKPENYADMEYVLMQDLPAKRAVQLRGLVAIGKFVQEDSFFAVPAPTASRELRFRYNQLNQVQVTNVCRRQERLRTCSHTKQIRGTDYDGSNSAALAGLMGLESSTSLGFLSKGTEVVSRLDAVFGSPFPLKTGQAFGYDATYVVSGSFPTFEVNMRLTCAVKSIAPAGDALVLCARFDPHGTAILRKLRWDPEAGLMSELAEVL